MNVFEIVFYIIKISFGISQIKYFEHLLIEFYWLDIDCLKFLLKTKYQKMGKLLDFIQFGLSKFKTQFIAIASMFWSFSFSKKSV